MGRYVRLACSGMTVAFPNQPTASPPPPGGYRVEAFMYSELFPSERRGSNYTGMMHSSDWYATFVEGVAGGAIPPETGPRKPDSHNVWDAVFHDQESPRTEIIHLVSNR